jgi:hypothetical protein
MLNRARNPISHPPVGAAGVVGVVVIIREARP